MDFLNLPLLATAALVFLSLISGLVSARFGFSFLLVFLIAGILVGEDGPGRVRFEDFTLSFWVGNIALAVILLDGGLRTSLASFRAGLRPSLLLATAGVGLTAGITGLAAAWLLGIDWRLGLLLGSIVGSTDAAAVFALLKNSGVTLNERVGRTLEIESGMNDPMAVYLTFTMIGLALAVAPPGAAALAGALWTLVEQFGLGALAGVAGGLLMSKTLQKVPVADPGITALLIASFGLVVFAATGLAGGSGFLAAYLLGMVLSSRVVGRVALPRVEAALAAMDAYAWLAQAGMFLLLGLLVTPSEVVRIAWPAVGVALVLMLVARPLAVWVCLLPFHFRPGEVVFIAWVGLRGAVPIVLAVFPLMAGVPNAKLLFNVAFVVVLLSLLLQGATIGVFARALGVALPDPLDERRSRSVFGDFVLDPSTPVGAVCEFYGLAAPSRADLGLGPWMSSALGRTPIVGDEVPLGAATLVIRGMADGDITLLGLKLPAP